MPRVANVVDPRTERNMDALAERVANGQIVAHAGAAMGLTKGETSNVWRQIKSRLGRQAA